MEMPVTGALTLGTLEDQKKSAEAAVARGAAARLATESAQNRQAEEEVELPETCNDSAATEVSRISTIEIVNMMGEESTQRRRIRKGDMMGGTAEHLFAAADVDASGNISQSEFG